jgi:hypothetical protein
MFPAASFVTQTFTAIERSGPELIVIRLFQTASDEYPGSFSKLSEGLALRSFQALPRGKAYWPENLRRADPPSGEGWKELIDETGRFLS